ncbi:ABC transporter ATP-binding protein/permease [Clostridium estertheticum]|uniref:ABC transporter ATP-binding protein n=1 Tax=Clostridium estertheticum TaxID=238834 RepID=UPI001CF47C9E|nr:ABC transporter ATP-binding protein [Clostridium estertheticum]MCB2307969.1 ABC transporter ATP-binding protein/permease [Clostridium estertheticum]MCB2346093.1 ABC transporter ATP-binding protein/permease [Clostridium estertheticum]MCB2351351.1 ABC transporter ATP-binding protein/permease [Clostridium estertheticum]WAG44236.1 ABC transporter ATP-binding protein/permease [Clostridium estertheticum]
MNKTIFKRIIKYMSNSKIYVVFSLISAIITVILSLIAPLLIGKTIDKMIGKGLVDFSYVFKIIIAIAIVYVAGNIFNWLLIYLTNLIAFSSVNHIRQDLFKKTNKLPLNFFDTNPHGDTISRFVNDIETISDGMIQCLSTLITGIVTIIGAIGFMVYLNPIMTLVVLILSPASYFMARFITNRSQKMFKKQAKILGNLNAYAEEIIDGQKVVKAFNFEDETINKFKEINSDLYSAGVKSQFYGSLSGPTTRVVNNIIYSLIGIIGSFAVIFGKLTIGDISSFLIYATLFSKPLNDITAIFTQIQAAAASAERVFYVIDMEPEIADKKRTINLHNNEGVISFRNVNFGYTPNRPLIKNFNLNVKPGSRVAIVGTTGAGKTTLINLLMRFYEINSGGIFIDGININEISRDSLRCNFGMVLQDTWLFCGTIKENIAYGKPDATEDEIITAAKASGSHSFIRRLPKGYNTIISDAGENLSQGQRQLLTIARVMIANAPMLILDEATSNIDTITELKIQKAFIKMLKGRTSFIIAHRLSTIKESDIILVMDNGNIVQSGTHEELLEKGGQYSQLYNSQFAAV